MSTPLISLDPIGVGTSMVESLDSYTHRVAAAHCVPRSHIDLLVQSGGRSLSRPKCVPQTVSLNSPICYARIYGDRMAELTGRVNAGSLSLSRFAGVLSKSGAQRQYRAWCWQCVKEARDRRTDPYWPLVWSIPDYQVCHVHAAYLTSHCPTCGHASRLKRPWKGPMHTCPNCSRPLDAGHGATAGLNRVSRAEFAIYDAIASEAIGELVSSIAKIQTEGLEIRNNFAQLLRHVGEVRGEDTRPGTIARIAGLSTGTAHSLANATFASSLTILVRLAVVFDVSLPGLVSRELWRTGISHGRAIIGIPNRRVPVRHDWSHIQTLIKDASESNEPKSLHAICQSLKICHNHTRRTLKSETTQLISARRERYEAQVCTRAKELASKICALETELIGLGLKVSDRKLANALGVDRSKRLFKSARQLSIQ